MKVAVYVRVSSERQAEKEISIPAQLKAIQQYCDTKAWTIVEHFIEKGRSAKTDNRPEFQRMIALAKRSSRPFQAVIVHKFDRFSRVREDHVVYKALLHKCGVQVISVTEQTERHTPQDKLLEGVLEVISEFFNANLAVEVRKGMTQNAKQGYNNGGTPPYGYRTEYVALGNQKTKAVWIPGPEEEIEVVRSIFNQYAYEEMGYHKIAATLNERNIPTQKGRMWSSSTIRAIIYNEVYIGRRCWNKQDYQTDGVKWRDRSEWVIAENAHPPLIPVGLFNLCQEKAKERHNGGGVVHKEVTSVSPFWLRGVMVCDKCGSRMVGNTTSAKTGGHQYYICGGYQRKGKGFCSYVSWKKERVEEIVRNKVRMTIHRLLMDNQFEEEIRLYHDDKNRGATMKVASLDAEIGFFVKRIQSVEDDIASGKAKPYHVDMLADMKEELAAKVTEREALANSIEDISVTEEKLAAIQYDLKALMGLLDDRNADLQLLHQFAGRYISKMFIHRDTEKMYLTFCIEVDAVVVYEKTVVADF